jgi:hypothetical protein
MTVSPINLHEIPYDKGYANGYRAGVEDAAKEIEDMENSKWAKRAAAAIRALAEKVKP